MSGHPKRKTTHFISDKTLAMPLREEMGTLRVPKGWVSATPPLQGKDATGTYLTSYSEVYTPLTCERLAQAWWRGLLLLGVVEGGVNSGSDTANTASLDAPSLQDPTTSSTTASINNTAPTTQHPIGSRVEVFWHKDKRWYAGTVAAHGTSRTTIKGNRITVPDIQIKYDDGTTLTHMLHANAIRQEGGVMHLLSCDERSEHGSGASMLRELDDDGPILSMLLHDRQQQRHNSSELEQANRLLSAELNDEQMHEHNTLIALEQQAYHESSHLMSAIEAQVKDSLMQQQHETDEVDSAFRSGVHSHAGETMVVTCLEFDIEDNLLLNKSCVFLVSNEGKLMKARSLDTAHARFWHTPINEREYKMSPQRDLWRTAKELKWDKYLALNMFEWVSAKSVNQAVNRIYSTLWAYKIKFEEGLKFSKLNPRWCLKGGTMDREKFKAHAETLRMSSYRAILSCKGGYWHAFCEFLLDCSDAFQATRTDDVPEEEQVPLYCWPAPGFERTVNGERMVCKVNVAMQGRIDATLLFNTKLFDLLVLKAGMTRLQWDRQVAVYHVGPLRNSAASLSEVLTAVRDATDTPVGEPPVGYRMQYLDGTWMTPLV